MVKRSKVNLQGAGVYCGGLPHSLLFVNLHAADKSAVRRWELAYTLTSLGGNVDDTCGKYRYRNETYTECYDL